MENTIEVTAVGASENYATEIKYSGGSSITDEPADKGGKGAGPSPTELLGGSLASCTAITLKMYAARKSWTVGDIKVNVSITSTNSRIFFICSVNVTEKITDEMKKRLVQIAEKCPVHKILVQSVEIRTQYSVNG